MIQSKSDTFQRTIYPLEVNIDIRCKKKAVCVCSAQEPSASIIDVSSSVKVNMNMSLEETLRRIEKKLAKIEAEIKEMRHRMLEGMKVNERPLISLPDHLRKTVMGLLKAGQGTASDVSRYTDRARAVESGYLNQLEREGFVRSFRDGRRKVFLLEEGLRDKLSQSRA